MNDDLTNRQLLEAMTDMLARQTDVMDTLASEVKTIRKHLNRLEAKFDNLREGLAQAAKPI